MSQILQNGCDEMQFYNNEVKKEESKDSKFTEAKPLVDRSYKLTDSPLSLHMKKEEAPLSSQQQVQLLCPFAVLPLVRGPRLSNVQTPNSQTSTNCTC